jgi:hypothetical protein
MYSQVHVPDLYRVRHHASRMKSGWKGKNAKAKAKFRGPGKQHPGADPEGRSFSKPVELLLYLNPRGFPAPPVNCQASSQLLLTANARHARARLVALVHALNLMLFAKGPRLGSAALTANRLSPYL